MKLSPLVLVLGAGAAYLLWKNSGSDSDTCTDVQLAASSAQSVTLAFVFSSGPALHVTLNRASGTTTSHAQDAAAVLAIKAGAVGKTRAQIDAEVKTLPAFASAS